MRSMPTREIHAVWLDELHGVDLSTSMDQTAVYRMYKVTPGLLSQVQPSVDEQFQEFMGLNGWTIQVEVDGREDGGFGNG